MLLVPLIISGNTYKTTNIEINEEPENKIEQIEQVAPIKPDSIKGIYITASTASSKRFPELVEQLRKSGGNAVVIDIEIGGGKLAFEPKNQYLKNINAGSQMLNNLPEIIKELHDKDIYVIARQVAFNDPYISLKKPEWRIKYKWGGGYFDYRWLDPSKSGVQNYNLMIMQEVARMGFDEIQLDYIRFPATNHSRLNYHYDEENFSRSDIINDFLKKAQRIAKEENVVLGVDVFGAAIWGEIDWKIVGQSIPEMAEFVDVIYPMTYPSHISPGYNGFTNPYGNPYSFVHESIKKFRDAVEGKAEIRTWIQGFPLRMYNFGEKTMKDQVKATFDAGANDFIIWSPSNIYTYSWNSMKITPAINTPLLEKTE